MDWKSFLAKCAGVITSALGLALLFTMVGLIDVGSLECPGDEVSALVSSEAQPTVGSTPGASPTATAVLANPNPRTINLLLLGMDRRDDQGGQPTRSDTMMVVSLDQKQGRVSMLSIPRDLYLPIPICGKGIDYYGQGTLQNRINTANFMGDYWQCEGGGSGLAMKTVEQNFGIPLDYYAAVDFRGFEKAIDAIGGITIDVEQPIYDYAYPLPDYSTTEVYFPAGRQQMDGVKALQYARTRHADSDFGRMQRQQQVLMAVREKLSEPATWLKLPALITSLYGSFQTDLPLPDLISMAVQMRDVQRDDILVRSVDTTMVYEEIMADGADVVMPVWPRIRAVVDEVLERSSN